MFVTFHILTFLSIVFKYQELLDTSQKYESVKENSKGGHDPIWANNDEISYLTILF